MAILTLIRKATAIVPLVAILLLAAPEARAQSKEYAVKANMLVSIAQAVRFPANAQPPAGAPFTIGILGSDPFGGTLDAVVKSESIGGRSVAVRRGSSVGELRGCQVIFSRSGGGAAAAGGGVLTVSETGSFARGGGMIDFVVRGGTVAFEINVGAMKKAGLQPTSNLLRLGTPVGE